MSFSEIIHWSDLHAGAVMSVLTAVYVIATLLILLQSRRSANLQREALAQAAELERDRLRPRVLATLDFLPGSTSASTTVVFAHVSITNLGVTAAVDVLVKCDPEIVGTPFEGKVERRPSILNQTLSFLAPQQRVRDLIDESSSFFERYESTRFAIEASYKDVSGHSYYDRYHIDSQPLKDTTQIQDPKDRLVFNLARTAEAASSDLSKIARALSAPDRSNLMMPLSREMPLSPPQRQLLEKLQAVQQSVGAGFMAYHVLDRPQAIVRSLESEQELAGPIADLEYLIRAGYLHGHYEGSTLRFWISSPAMSSDAGPVGAPAT